MKKYVISDIHGSIECLQQCLNRCRFDYDKDMLITNGDVCDIHDHTFEVMDELLKIKNLVFVMGNHDIKLFNWLNTNMIPNNWLNIGGDKTISSYIERDTYQVSKHLDILKNAKNYHIEDNILFIHGGIDHRRLISKNSKRTMFSNRTLWEKAKQYDKQHLKFKVREFSKSEIISEIIIGHTPVNVGKDKVNYPKRLSNVWNIDTGCGNGNVLSIMDIHSKKYWQSDCSL